MIHSYRSFGYGRHVRLGHLVGAALWGIFPTLFLIGAIADRNPPFFLGAAAFSALWMWPAYTDLFRRAYEIRLGESGFLEFEAPLRTVSLGAHELVSIKPARWAVNDQAYLEIRDRNGKFWVAWPLHRFDDFLARLGRMNPAVKVEARARLLRELPASEKYWGTAAMPAHLAPWGHDGIPIVREAVKAHPVFAAFVGLFPLFTLGVLFQETRDNLWPYLFMPFIPAMWWLLIWLHVRGWITFDDD
jgi:hypothetical protein